MLSKVLKYIVERCIWVEHRPFKIVKKYIINGNSKKGGYYFNETRKTKAEAIKCAKLNAFIDEDRGRNSINDIEDLVKRISVRDFNFNR